MINGKNKIAVGMADIKIGKAPCIITTILGSCIGVCLYSSANKIGGVLHLMIAASNNAQHKDNFKAAKYADTGIPAIIQQLKNTYGISSKDLSAKIFGGAKVLKGVTSTVGADNQKAVQAILKNEGIPILASKLGGDKGYRINFNLETGKVECQIFGNKFEEY